MKFLVEASGGGDRVARAEGEVVFHIFSEAYWDPLVVVSNNSLLVEESTSIAITAYDLQVGRREGGGTSSLGQPLPLNECILSSTLCASRGRETLLARGEGSGTCLQKVSRKHQVVT